MHTIDFSAGTHIDRAAMLLVAAAAEHGEAQGSFNDIMLTAKAGAAPADVVDLFNRESAARAEAWRNSPEGKAAEQRRVQAIADAQAKHDKLVLDLMTLDFKNPMAVLDWLCAIQDATDHVGVRVEKAVILDMFTGNGFKPGVNCGSDYKADDRDNSFRWLVGQALDGLQHVAIHGVIHRFAADWKAKFQN